MCILTDGSMCHLLSATENRAQHDFEERKGRIPVALVERLHNEGIMTREDYFRHSYQRRLEHATKTLSHHYGYYGGLFYPNMDCAPEESEFMKGSRHDLVRDPHLPQDLWDRLVPKFTAGRRQEFRLRLANCTSKAQATYLGQYPECAMWLAEYLHAATANESRLDHVISLVTKNSKLLAAFTSIASPQALQNACTHIFCALLNDGLLRRDVTLSHTIEAMFPEKYRGGFKSLRQKSDSTEKLPRISNKQNRIYRQKRRQLRHALRNWTRHLSQDVSISDVVQKIAILLVEVREVEKHPLPLAA